MKVMRKAGKPRLPRSEHPTHPFGTILVPDCQDLGGFLPGEGVTAPTSVVRARQGAGVPSPLCRGGHQHPVQ